MKMWSEEKMLKVFSTLFIGLFVSLGITSALHILSPEHQHHCIQSEDCKSDTNEETDSKNNVAETYYCHLEVLAQTPFSFTPYLTLSPISPVATDGYTLTIEKLYTTTARQPFALRAPPYLV